MPGISRAFLYDVLIIVLTYCFLFGMVLVMINRDAPSFESTQMAWDQAVFTMAYNERRLFEELATGSNAIQSFTRNPQTGTYYADIVVGKASLNDLYHGYSAIQKETALQPWERAIVSARRTRQQAQMAGMASGALGTVTLATAAGVAYGAVAATDKGFDAPLVALGLLVGVAAISVGKTVRAVKQYFSADKDVISKESKKLDQEYEVMNHLCSRLALLEEVRATTFEMKRGNILVAADDDDYGCRHTKKNGGYFPPSLN